MQEETKIRLEVRDETIRLLRALAEQGLFGSTKEEVAVRLLDEKLREVVLQGWVGVPGVPGVTMPLVR